MYGLPGTQEFPKMMDLIRIYFQNTTAKDIMARNQLIDLATALSDLKKDQSEHQVEVSRIFNF